MSKEYIERGALLELETFLQDADGFDCSAVLSVDIRSAKAADVVEVKHGRCPVCNGEKAILQDCYNGVSVEVDAEQQEMSVWLGDECLAVFSIDYCPNCGAKMLGE